MKQKVVMHYSAANMLDQLLQIRLICAFGWMSIAMAAAMSNSSMNSVVSVHRRYLSSAAVDEVSLTDLPTWMTKTWNKISDKAINSIWLPGTHNSLTYDLGEDKAPADNCFYTEAYARKWAVTQLTDVQHQLNSGFRYLDIRPYASDNGDIRIYHCLLSNLGLWEYMAHISEWLKTVAAGSNEVLVLHFKNFIGDGNSWDDRAYENLKNIMNKYFGSFMYGSPTATKGDVTLSKIVGKGGPKVLWVVETDDNGYRSLLGHGAQYINYHQFMDRSYRETDNVQVLVDYGTENFKNHQKKGKTEVMVIEGVMTANQNVIQNFYLSETVENPNYVSVLITWEEGDQKTTGQMLHLGVFKEWLKMGKKGVILMLDNPHSIDAQYIINLNLKNERKAVKEPQLFNYGPLVVTEDEDGNCQGVVSGSCAPGYELKSWDGQCYFWCCGGPGAGSDCGCDVRAQRACGL
ncbi:hypothetical protein CEUSTIGMA_g2919.t1 [Chlamydomonas eustigma]|uniref:Phosphatidylinositol-specific phospholipase C X domain-containing protein n=1 Tax=Chlamydomonas eustigma TaxID=1157962 RepID=A0A250WXG5_9CHLO|nr:hypothetical protein CEUSTIGMA_g2919.t1 [Chlamydomonas eustigma]|eukprot:GAX75476.1 hypothetical protein CEUSTIGMA_g2919.t1 [Chlamydomonas eustigma]